MEPEVEPSRSSKCLPLVVTVVAVLVLCFLSIPNLVSARLHGNETATIGLFRTMPEVQRLYREGTEQRRGRGAFGSLRDLKRADLFLWPAHERWTREVENPDGTLGLAWYGYTVEVHPSTDPRSAWYALAVPRSPNDGRRCFFVNHSGRIHAWEPRPDQPIARPLVDAATCDVPPKFTPLPH